MFNLWDAVLLHAVASAHITCQRPLHIGHDPFICAAAHRLQERFDGKVPLIKFDDDSDYLPDSDAIVKELEARYPQQRTGQQQDAQQM